MSRLRRRSLLWQLEAGLIVIHALILTALGWYAASQIRTFHEEQARRELDHIAVLLADRYGAAMAQGVPEAELDRMAGRDGTATGTRVTVILADGRVVADSHHHPAVMDNHLYRPEVAQALRLESGSAERYSRTVDQSMMYLARTIPGEPGAPRAVIRAALPLATLERSVAGLLRALAIAALVSLLLTSGAMYLISRRLSATIGRLAEGAARFAGGGLDHRVTVPPNRELGRLATALNDMARQLDERIDQFRVQRNEQQAILQSMSNGVIALDLQQRILSVNRAAERMLDLEGESVRGRLLQEAVREPGMNRFVGAAMQEPGPHQEEFALERDRRRRIQLSSERLTDAQGRPAGLLIILNDVTELRRLESLRSDFASNVSHELRTPITNIKGYVETLLEVGLDERDQARRFLGVIRQNADRLAAIVEDIMALTRLEQPETQQRLQREPASIPRLLQSVTGQLEPAAAAKSITLRRDVPERLRARIHRQLVEQAVGNLLSNAVKYSSASTVVTLSARALDEGAIEITVADEGPGIPKEHLPRLFERFYRVDKARSRELGGTGLGLAIVKHVALVHGGRVEVESEVGRGSVFRLVLPGAEPSPEIASEV